MIKSFSDKNSEELYITGYSKKFPATIIKTALRKPDYLNAAYNLNDLNAPPGNKLEPLKGKYEDHYSIRINNQYRIVFKFENHNSFEVQILDYH
jgi:toxin HigB-1